MRHMILIVGILLSQTIWAEEKYTSCDFTSITLTRTGDTLSKKGRMHCKKGETDEGESIGDLKEIDVIVDEDPLFFYMGLKENLRFKTVTVDGEKVSEATLVRRPTGAPARQMMMKGKPLEMKMRGDESEAQIQEEGSTADKDVKLKEPKKKQGDNGTLGASGASGAPPGFIP